MEHLHALVILMSLYDFLEIHRYIRSAGAFHQEAQTNMDDSKRPSSRDGTMRQPSNQQPYVPANRFSRSSLILTWVILPLIVALLSYTSPLIVIFLPFLLLPTLGLLWYDRSHQHDQRTDLETFLWTYFLTGTVGTMMIIIIQSIISYGVAWLLFRSETDKFFKEFSKQETDIAQMDADSLLFRKAMAHRWQHWAFLFVVSFVAAGVVEESLKYYGLQFARRYGRVLHPKNYLTLAMAAALGFSTIEGIGFVCAAVKDGQALNRVVLTVLERVVFGPPSHALGAALIGLNVVRRDFHGERLRFGYIIGPSVLFHGFFDFVILGVSAYEGNVGWIHPRGKSLLLVLAFAIGFLTVMATVVRRRLAVQGDFKVSVDHSIQSLSLLTDTSVILDESFIKT